MRSRTLGTIAAVYLTATLLLGGASAAGAAANALLQVSALILIIIALWVNPLKALPTSARAFFLIAAVFALVGVLSLVPLPAAVWSGLPFRDRIMDGFRLLGMEQPALPWSLTPARTLASVLALLPPLALFLLCVALPLQERRRLALVIIVVAAISIGLGAFQLLGGRGSPLRFYAVTNPDSAVGFFANANHQATLLLCTLPFIGYLAAKAATRRGSRSKKSGAAVLSLALGIFITIGIAVVGSIAGYGMYLPTAVASILIYRRAIAGRLSARWIASLTVLLVIFAGLAVAGPLGNERLTGEFGNDPTSRRVIAETTLEGIGASFPAGTGLGSFADVYRFFEQRSTPGNEYINHAHNDYLELVLELGLPGLLLLIAGVIWWGRQTLTVWTREFEGVSLARAGSVAIGVVIAHSFVEYPIRTAAIAGIVAVAASLMTSPPAPEARKGKRDKGSESLRHLEAS